MFAIPENGYMTEQNLVGKRHCILVASNNPEPLPSPVYRPNIQNCGPATLLSDAETVARWFGLCSVSLSVISTRKLPKIRALYEAGKRNPNAEDPPVHVQQPQFLVLISEGFMEARAALAPTGLAPYQDSVQPLDTNLAASSSYQPENPPREQSYSGTSMSAYGAIAGDLQPVDATLGSCSATSYGNTIFPVDLPQPSGYFEGQHSAGLNASAASMFTSQESSIPLPAPQSKYVKLWEGNLSGKMHGKAVLITRLEAYRTTSTSEMLAATWPDSMEIHRILTRDSVNRNFIVRSAVILVFKVLTNHAFLSQLLERNLSAVVELPCQTLLLSATDKVNILIGLIFPTIQDGQTSNFGIAATPPLQGGQLQHHPPHPAI